MNEEDDPVPIPFNGTIDLHQFHPSDTKALIEELIFECLQKGIFTGRIIHGKGIGTLRETVHATLKKHPSVKGFSLGDQSSGGWGSTTFWLGENHKLA
jgi:dsDNA-specific endonuclease/ATPase MutS2